MLNVYWVVLDCKTPVKRTQMKNINKPTFGGEHKDYWGFSRLSQTFIQD